MSGTVIAIVNMKGGVGKTTLSVALSESLAVMARRRVLVIDLDAQASCTYALIGKDRFQEARREYRHTYQLFDEFCRSIGGASPVPIAEPLTPTADEPVFFRMTRRRVTTPPPRPVSELVLNEASWIRPIPNLSLLAAIPELQILEREIMYRLGQHANGQEDPDGRIAEFFRKRLDWARANYDVIVIDCPPGISAFTAAAIRDADVVYAPVMPDYLSLLGLDVFAQNVLRPLSRRSQRPLKSYVVLNRVQGTAAHDQRKREIRQLAARMDDVLRMFPQEIEQSQDLAVASDGAEFAVSIREKYRSAIPTLEEMVRTTLDVCEGTNGRA